MERQTTEIESNQLSYRILIVEDEILIADTLARYLKKKGYQVVGIAISYEEAEQLYLQENPDMVLLDIRLNGPKSGVDFAHFIKKQNFPKPFIYLSSQLDSFNIGLAKETFPAGFLSKPIQKNSLYTSIEMVMHKHLTSKEKEKEISIELFDGNKHFLVPLKEILYLEADHIYVKVHVLGNKKILQRSPLKAFLAQLPPNQFLRPHRSFAVNITHISHWDNTALYIQDIQIPISRSRKKAIQKLLNSR